MTRLLVAYDGSAAARSALEVAGALFPGAEVVVAHVRPEPTRFDEADPMLREGLARLGIEAAAEATETLAEGVELAGRAGLLAVGAGLAGPTPWRALRAEAAERDADVLVCGTRAASGVERALLGSTASSLVHHADRPLLVVPAGAPAGAGPVVAGYDGSEGSQTALRFAAAHFADRVVTVAHAWRSPVRHTLRSYALAHSGVDTLEDYVDSLDEVFRDLATEPAEEGAAFARSLGLRALARAPESGEGDWQALVSEAQRLGAAVVLVGSRGRGALAATVLGSVASGLVHAGKLPVLIVP